MDGAGGIEDMIPIYDFTQYDDSWWAARLGKITASPANKLITTKGLPTDGKTREDYCYRLAMEQAYGQYAGSEYTNYGMQRGHEMEPKARTAFEIATGFNVQTVGIVFEDEQRKWACSPDGMMETAGLEIFCPEAPNAICCLRNPEKAISIAGKFQQIQMSLMITGFEQWYFEVYYPGPAPLIQIVKRDEDFISKLRAELDKFCIEIIMTAKEIKGTLAGVS
ncbi:MAG: YqaJ viral recombinase family protein [Deltaproteobacteria bacterium]|nr:YqaJ viral recombinase family protein [Deltaproteobacteria bacterium]